MRRLGYAEVKTPQLMPLTLWERSGHWEKFGEAMFTMAEAEERSMALKPMSCPCHVALFNRGRRSWRELPLRYAEFGACHRNEPSGALLGLLRTRGFEQDDTHVFCRAEDVAGEVGRFAELLALVYRELGFSDYKVALSTRPVERAGSDELWDWAEATLAEAASRCGLIYGIQPGASRSAKVGNLGGRGTGPALPGGRHGGNRRCHLLMGDIRLIFSGLRQPTPK